MKARGTRTITPREPKAPRSWFGLQPPVLIVLLATVFNVILALVNANGVNPGRNGVAAVELLINVAALVLVVRGWRHSMTPWALLLGSMIMGFLLLSLVKEIVEPKFVRDVMIIPIFVMLGMTAWRLSLVRFILVLQTIVFLVTVFEGALPDRFGAVFNVTSYYVNTRGFSEEDFWAGDNGLFVSSFRPGERFLFNSLNIHRLSSIFLEPVSLGNYLVIMVAIIVALRREFGWSQLAYLAFTSFVILVGCDGRQATMQIGLVFAIAVAYRLLPRPVAALYLPLAVAASFAAVSGLSLVYTGDDFVGRIVYSVKVLRSFDLTLLMGTYGGDIGWTYDSGIGYFIASQSIIGVIVTWFTIAFCAEAEDRASRIFINAVCMYLALSLLVSNAAFSIKTAALMWFMLGYLNERAAMRLRQRQRLETKQPATGRGGSLEPAPMGAE